MNLAVTRISEQDRAGDGNLLPAVREKALEDVKRILSVYGRREPSLIAELLNISRKLAKILTDEVVTQIREEESEELVAQELYVDSVLDELTQTPDKYSKDPTTVVRMKLELLDKKNALRRLRNGELSPKERDALINFHIWGTVREGALAKFDRYKSQTPKEEYEKQTQLAGDSE